MGSQGSLFRRYKWDNLTDPEKEAVKDALAIAATRAGVGVGAVLTTALIISNARRGKPPLPPLVRYGSLTAFSIAGAYAGFLTGGPIYARRVLSVPNSQLAEDLRIVVGDWQARVPVDPMNMDPIPGSGGTPPEEVGPPPPVLPPGGESEETSEAKKSLAYRLGLTKF